LLSSSLPIPSGSCPMSPLRSVLPLLGVSKDSMALNAASIVVCLLEVLVARKGRKLGPNTNLGPKCFFFPGHTEFPNCVVACFFCFWLFSARHQALTHGVFCSSWSEIFFFECHCVVSDTEMSMWPKIVIVTRNVQRTQLHCGSVLNFFVLHQNKVKTNHHWLVAFWWPNQTQLKKEINEMTPKGDKIAFFNLVLKKFKFKTLFLFEQDAFLSTKCCHSKNIDFCSTAPKMLF